MADERDAKIAVEDLNGTTMDGQEIKVEISHGQYKTSKSTQFLSESFNASILFQQEREVPDQETEEDAEEEASDAVTIDEEEGMTEGAVDSIAVEVAAEMIEGTLDFSNPFHLASFLIFFTIVP